MGDSRWERLAPLAGVDYVVLLVVGLLVMGGPDILAPADEIVDHYTEDFERVRVGGYLGMLAVFFFLWFVGSLRSFLRPAEGGTGRLSAVAFGGGVAAGALYLASFTMSLAATYRADEPGGIGSEAATTLFDFGGFLSGWAASMALAVLMAATAVVGFRTAVLPGWLAWVTALIAVGLLAGPFARIVHFVFLAWVVFMSVSLYLQWVPTRAAPTTPSTWTPERE
ncbi:MAG: hypothetical protein ACE5KX_06225 [Acidimicrobiia bacterium]